jgi:molecular chaperone DnaK (HSP70)
LKKECVKKKIELSNCNKVTIEVDNLKDDHDFNINLTRNDFEEICKDLFNKCIPIIEKVLKNAKLTKEKISDIILLGGSSKIPKIKEIIKDYFKKEINDNIINPKESISIGAAIQGAIINNIENENLKKLTLFDICSGSIGVVRKGEMKFLIPKDSIIPCKKTEKYRTTKDNQDTLVLKIYQGENKIAKDNKFLGNWIISNIPQKPKGEIIIDVDYEVDLNNFLNVTARTIEKDKNNKIHNINILKVDIDNNVMNEELIDELIEKEKDLEEDDEKEYQKNKLKNKIERYLLEIEKIGTEEEKLIAVKMLKWLKEHPNESIETYEEELRKLKNLVKINFDDLDNVIPLSLGLELRNGEMDFLIKRNTKLPYEKTYTFKTGIDNQSKIVLRVYQGERIVAQENKFLGRFIISNIPAKPKGEVKVDVTFMLENKDVMNIKVKISGLNQVNNFTFNIENDFDEKEIEKLVKIAKEKEQEDREFIENINKLEAEALLE